MNLSKDQMAALKIDVAKYEAWLRGHEESAKRGQDLLNKVKNRSGSTGNNWSLVLDDVDKLMAQAYRELVD